MATLPTNPATGAPSGNKPGPSPHAPASPRRWPPQPWWLVFSWSWLSITWERAIVPRGMALGATYHLPVDDRTSYAEDYLRARITCALGGRAAEKLVYGVATTGAENDLQQVTEIARHMVLRWGMSDVLGPISFVAPQDEGLPPAFQHQPYSEATSELIDAEVRRIVEESHREADRVLAAHRGTLDALARALLKAESLNAQEIRDVTGLYDIPAHLQEHSAR